MLFTLRHVLNMQHSVNFLKVAGNNKTTWSANVLTTTYCNLEFLLYFTFRLAFVNVPIYFSDEILAFQVCFSSLLTVFSSCNYYWGDSVISWVVNQMEGNQQRQIILQAKMWNVMLFCIISCLNIQIFGLLCRHRQIMMQHATWYRHVKDLHRIPRLNETWLHGLLSFCIFLLCFRVILCLW